MRSKTPLHARSHGPGGSDPITDAIRYDVSNDGDWLLVRTSDATPPGGNPAIYFHDDGGAGVKLLAGAGGNLDLVSSSGTTTLSGAAVGVAAAGAIAMTAGTGATLDVTGNTAVTSLGGITLTAGTSGATSPDGDLEMSGYDSVQVSCSIGDIGIDISNAGSPGDHCLRVTSNAATPHEIFRIDSDGTIHGQASVGVILWDIV